MSDQLDRIASVRAIAEAKHYSLGLLELTKGDRVLDIGCGNGPDLRELAELVGADGRVVGFDRSRTLIAQAGMRGLGDLDPVEFVEGDATALPFADAAFDACRADRTLQHVPNVDLAVAEMARVTRPGGRIVASEYGFGFVAPGWEEAARDRLADVMVPATERRNWIGLLLPALFQLAGLADVSVVQQNFELRDYDEIGRFTDVGPAIDAAVRTGAMTDDEARRLHASLREQVRNGTAFVAGLGAHVVGVKR
jgi:SAM-dependent methyltransferase